MKALEGVGAAPGQAAGRAWRYPASEEAMPAEQALSGETDPIDQRERLITAWRRVDADLDLLVDGLAATHPEEAAIFGAHQLWLDDPVLRDTALAAVEAGQSAATAWQMAYQAAARRLAQADDPDLANRAVDLEDVGARVLAYLRPTNEAPAGAHTLPDLYGRIVLAPDLNASQLIAVASAGAAGVALAQGGPTTHAAILARAFHLPLVTGLGEALDGIPTETSLIIDGDVGWLRIAQAAPSRAADDLSAAVSLPGQRVDGPTCTADGHPLGLWANAGALAEVEAAVAAGAGGIGLLRTEFLYLGVDQGGGSLPSEAAQVVLYRDLLTAAQGLPLVIRTLDPGGDKDLPGLRLPTAPNPALGWRGIRAFRPHSEPLRAQLRAILRAAAEAGMSAGRVQLMFPLIARWGEWRWARGLVAEAREALQADGVDVPPIPVGMMVEVPAAALLADRFAAEADFFSVGTNDLTQFLMAADRASSDLAAYHGPGPALLRLLAAVVDAAQAAGKPVALCGELAGDVAYLPLWVGLGFHRLSVPPSRVADLRAALGTLSYAEAREIARRALAARDLAEVRKLLGEPPLRQG